MRLVRLLLGALGLAAGAYGAMLLLDLGGANLRSTLVWVVGGVVVHDAVLAPLTIALGAGLVWLGRRGVRTGPLVVGGVVLGTVTVAAIPVLGRFGARADNATLLDRDYLVGWFVFAGATVVISCFTASRFSSVRSTLLSTTTGCAPLTKAAAR